MGYLLNNLLSSVGGYIYLFLWLIFFLNYLIVPVRYKKVVDFIAFMPTILFLVMFLGMRDYYSGSDSIRYFQVFNYMRNSGSGINREYEVLYQSFVELVSLIGGYNIYFVVVVLVQVFFVYFSAKNLGIKYKSLVLFMYVSLIPGFDMMTNGLRQGISASFSILIFSLFWKQHENYRYGNLILPLIHKSFVYNVPFVLIKKTFLVESLYERLKYVVFIIAAIGIGAHVFPSDLISEYLLRYFEYAIIGSEQTYGERMVQFITVESDMFSAGQFLYFYFIVIVGLLCYFYFDIKLKKGHNDKCAMHYIRNDDLMKGLFVVFVLMILPFAVFSSSPFAYRFFYIAYPYAVISIHVFFERYLMYEYKFIYYLLILGFGFVTYGSNTFKSFDYIW